MAIASKKQVQFPNVILNDVIIRNASAGILANTTNGAFTEQSKSLEISFVKSATPNDPLSLYSITFVEDINEPHVSGSMVIVDKSNIFDYLGVSTNAEIEMDISFIDTINERFQFTTTKKKLFFNIVDLETISDPANQQVSRDIGSANYINIRFSSKEFVHSNFVGHNLDYDKVVKSFQNFIGPISDNYNFTVDYTGRERSPIPTGKIKDIQIDAIFEGRDEDGNAIVTLPLATNVWPENTPTFFGNLISKYNDERKSKFSNRPKKGFKSHKTYNDVWIKPDYHFFPTFKDSSIPRLTQLINYVKESTCLWEAENFVDFMFWEDLDGFNFKSIAKMATESASINNTPTFFPDPNPQNMEAIISMEIIKDIEPVDLISSGALTSEYIRVKPNWNSPYRNVLSGEDQVTKELIKYNYKEDIFELSQGLKPKNDVVITNKRWIGDDGSSGIKGYPPFNLNEINYTSKKGDFNSSAFRISDEIYGFYDNTQYNAKYSPWWLFIDKNSRGFTWSGFTEDYNGDAQGLTYDFTKPARLEEEYWQAQYDFCELPGNVLYIIYNNIKWPLQDARQQYIEAKKLNKRWDFYFENICCERKVPLNFFALITSAKKIYGGMTGSTFQADPGGIYAYDWVEVEFWPREQVDAVLRTGDEIIKFENHEMYPFVFVKPKGALEGIAPLDRTYKNKIKKYDINSTKDKEGKIVKEGSIGKEDTKYKTKDTRAFNINEILNTVGITFNKISDYNKLTREIKDSIQECKFFVTNPGLAFPVDQENENCKTSYPKGFEMMPVGHFKYASSCDGSQIWPFGRIVQMHAIPREIMQTISKGEQGLTGINSFSSENKFITPLLPPPNSTEKKPIEFTETKSEDRSKYLFLFDVVNAHDGLCDNSCEV